MRRTEAGCSPYANRLLAALGVPYLAPALGTEEFGTRFDGAEPDRLPRAKEPASLLTDVFVTASFTTPFEGGFGGYLGGRFLKLAVLVLTYCVLGGASFAFSTWGAGGGAGGAGGASGAGACASGGCDLMWRP